ncbi:ABC transporter substrate-binding protein [Fictibacillus terranigra]|uniref:ABC transporter substrate-binding protein n=1 Tax=Fictibacillus terranigra TaxID=3058424 RepID=A0ABT8EDK8_9BACL|nr:ABC transporter substrate-binding protein [Fictibacillus sp. CENA-BCM004]MDN4076008.1 ABC transporter substrate-binding protein [Fictibacillus sp. CENA-BCM004]
MCRLPVKILLIPFLILTIVSGCSATSSQTGSGASSKDKVTINFWYTWGGDEAKIISELINEYNKSQDKVFVKGLNQGDIQKQMTAIVGGNPPDLASHYDENKLASWADRGVMLPLDKYIKEDNYDINDFVPAARSAVQYKDKTYALPIVMNTWMLYYNKDMLKKAGFDGPPETIQQLMEYDKKLSKMKDGRIEQLGIWPSQNPYMWMNAFNGKIWDPEKKEVTPLDPGFKKTVETNKKMWDRYGTKALDRFASGSGQYASAQNPFLAGKYAMQFDGEWIAKFAERYAPNLNYGVAPMPYDENHPESKNAGFMNVGTLYIPKGADHPDEAWKFLNWITQKEQMAKFAASLGNLAPRQSLQNDAMLKKEVPKYEVFMKYVTNGKIKSVPSVPFLDEYLEKINKTHDDILRGKVSVEEGLTRLKKEAQPLANKTKQ